MPGGGHVGRHAEPEALSREPTTEGHEQAKATSWAPYRDGLDPA